jgi:hypothetical protein
MLLLVAGCCWLLAAAAASPGGIFEEFLKIFKKKFQRARARRAGKIKI